jgi:glutathione S-transferase
VTFEYGKSHRQSSEFIKQNPRGLVPVLEAEGNYIWDSTAILVYLARRFDGESWLPVDGLGMSRVMQWLALAQSEILHGLMTARHIILGKRRGMLEEAQGVGRTALRVLEDRLQVCTWLASERPTIADIACYPHASRAPESGIPLDGYPAIRRWIIRIEELPGWVPWRSRGG